MSAPTDLENCSFTQFADAFLTLHRQGKRLTIDQAIEAFPHLEEEIRAQLPAMMLLDNAIGEVDNTEPCITDGQPIEGCFLKEEIGRGASGVVYRAYQPDLDREVAVKITRLVPEHSARFESERQAMARLEHPNIVPVYSYARVDSQAYLIMKLIDGYSISELLVGACDYQGKFLLNHLRDDWIGFANLGANLASGLQHAHERNLIHRDIKPSNILLDKIGHVWITDFGLVKTLDATRSLTATGDLVGTPKYMAPKQLRGHCDPRSDIYSLGLTLYELATGQQLQKTESAAEQSLANEKPKAARECRDVPESLMHIIRKASAFDPEDRYQSASEMNTVLRRFIDKKVPDRRKQRRKPDEVYHREYRKKLITAVVVSILGCSSFYMIFRTWRSTPKNTPAAPSRVTTIREPITSEASELPLASTNTLTEGLDQLIHGIETGALSDEDVSRVARRYRESKLSVVTRVMRIGEQIVASDLSERDKTEAIRVMDKLAKLTLSKQLPKEKTKEIVNQLTLDATLPVLPDGKRVDRNHLFGWLKKVASVVAPFELQLSEEDLNQELNRIFSEMNTTSGDTSSPAERKLQIQEFLDGKRDLVSPNLQKLLEKL